MTASTDKWFLRSRGVSDPIFRLICIPHAGGSASTYRVWSDGLPSTVEVCAVQFPGRQNRACEARYRRTEDAVDGLFAAIIDLLDIPFAIFGDCTGAFLALELCRRLRQEGRRAPIHLFVACCRAPQLPLRREPIYRLDDDGMAKELRRLDLAPSWLLDRQDCRDAFFPLFRDDFELAETYTHVPADCLALPITALAGDRDHITSTDEIAGWKFQTSAAFSVRRFDAGHDLTRTHRVQIVDAVLQALGSAAVSM